MRIPDTSVRQQDALTLRRTLNRAALVAGCGLLIASLAGVLAAHGRLFSEGKVESSLTFGSLFESHTLVAALALWLVAVIALHLGAALAIAAAWRQLATTIGVPVRQIVPGGILVLLGAVTCVLGLNALWYPQANLAGGFGFARNGPGPLLIYAGAIACGALLCAGALIAIARRIPRAGRGATGAIAVVAIVAMTALAWFVTGSGPAASVPRAQAVPDLIVIGIDSLRPDHVSANGFPLRTTPNVDAFFRDAVVFDDTITPLARTFPAWVSTMTGREPVSHGVRFNLVGGQTARQAGALSVTGLLREAGYYTVYATDEKRFSNIDRRFGFDAVLGPPAGAADFLLGTFGDLPLANLVSNTRAGRWLFPYTYGNRAAAATYRPETLLAMIDDGLRAAPRRPLFLGAHLCLPHWPFRWGGEPPVFTVSPPEPFAGTRLDYLNTVAAADRQFGELIELLARHGRLDNALLVLMSDHGESFSLDKDDLQIDTGSGSLTRRREIFGHGTDLLSQSQHHVVLAMQRRGLGGFEPRRVLGRVSLIDIAPTLLAFAGLPAPTGMDGKSLLGVLTQPGMTHFDDGGRGLSLETGITAPALERLEPDLHGAMAATAGYYAVDADGSVALGASAAAMLLEDKQRSLMHGRWQAVARHAGDGRYTLSVANLAERIVYAGDSLYKNGVPAEDLRQLLCGRFASDTTFASSALCISGLPGLTSR